MVNVYWYINEKVYTKFGKEVEVFSVKVLGEEDFYGYYDPFLKVILLSLKWNDSTWSLFNTLLHEVGHHLASFLGYRFYHSFIKPWDKSAVLIDKFLSTLKDKPFKK